MPSKNTHVRYDAIPFGSVKDLYTPDPVPGTAICQNEAAVAALRGSDDDDIVAAAPTGMAVGVKLASMPLTVVRLDEVPTAALEGIDVDGQPIETYELLVFGQVPSQQNHSLRNFA